MLRRRNHYLDLAPVVCLQHTRCCVYVSAKPERQRKVGHTARPCVFIFKTTSFANTPRLLCDVFLDFFCCAPLTLATGVRIKVTHLRDLFRPDARNFPRRHEAGFGDVRRIFAFYLAQICAVQISGVIIEKSRRSCCFPRSPRLLTSFHLEKFHVTIRFRFMAYVSEPPSRVKRNIRLTMEVRERFADRTTF